MKNVGSKARLVKHYIPLFNNIIRDKNIKTYIEPFVGGASVESLRDVLLDNTGTKAFSNLFKCCLTPELYEIYKKYSDTNYIISDEFEVLLGEKVVDKINSLINGKAEKCSE